MTLYQPFLAAAIALLRERLELEPDPIPPGFERQVAIAGKGQRATSVETTSYGFRAPKLRQIRAAHVQGGEALQVLNVVIFPQCHYDLPVFGADLVTLPGGHLVALDVQPLFRDDPAYQAKYAEPLLPICQRYRAVLPWGGDLPEAARPFFSPAVLWSRPQTREMVENLVFQAFQDYLQCYLTLVEQADPVQDSERLAAIAQAQQRYIRYRADKDPARRMFTRFYGAQWTEAYIHGFLFKLEQPGAIAPGCSNAAADYNP